MGGRGSSSGLSANTYSRFSYSVRMGGGNAEERKQASESVSMFMKNAKIGDVYSVGVGFGSQGGQKFEVVSRGSKMALKWQGSTRHAVKFDRNNVRSFISNGATLVSRKK